MENAKLNYTFQVKHCYSQPRRDGSAGGVPVYQVVSSGSLLSAGSLSNAVACDFLNICDLAPDECYVYGKTTV